MRTKAKHWKPHKVNAIDQRDRAAKEKRLAVRKSVFDNFLLEKAEAMPVSGGAALLCRIGIHKWVLVDNGELTKIMGDRLYLCGRHNCTATKYKYEEMDYL